MRPGCRKWTHVHQTVATCETEELRCKAAVFKSNVCFNVKANVVTDNNKIAEFEKHGVSFKS